MYGMNEKRASIKGKNPSMFALIFLFVDMSTGLTRYIVALRRFNKTRLHGKHIEPQVYRVAQATYQKSYQGFISPLNYSSRVGVFAR